MQWMALLDYNYNATKNANLRRKWVTLLLFLDMLQKHLKIGSNVIFLQEKILPECDYSSFIQITTVQLTIYYYAILGKIVYEIFKAHKAFELFFIELLSPSIPFSLHFLELDK